MSIRSRLPRASVAKGPLGISFHSSEAADHLNCTRVSTGHWCGTGLKKAHLTVRVSLARLFQGKIRFPASGGRNRNRATESDKARIGRTESDRLGRNGSWVRNPARRLSAWKGDGQNQIE